MPRRKRGQAAPGIRQRFETSQNTWTQQINRRGQLVYLKNGKFTTARAFHAAQNHAKRIDPPGILRMSEGQDRIMRDVAFTTKEGVWVAGPDIQEILPHLEVGERIDRPRDIEYARSYRADQRRFFGFWQTKAANQNLTYEEAADKYSRFVQALEQLKPGDIKGKQEILEEFGLGSYSKKRAA